MVSLGITDENREETQLEDQNNVRPKLETHEDGNCMKPSEEAALPEPPLIVEQFCIQIFVDQITGKGKLLSPHYAWNEPLVRNIAQ